MQKGLRRNFLRPLGKSYTSLDDGIFRKYLTIPNCYLRGILLRNKTNLQEVPLELPQLIKQCDDYFWGRLKVTQQTKEEMMRNVSLKIAGVPPAFMNRSELPSTTGANLSVYSQIIDNPSGFASLGRVLYFHSTFEENSMLAASNIIKAGVAVKLKCRMAPLATFMDSVKTFEESSLIKSMHEADIACMTMLGACYLAQSGFTESTLQTFLDQRRLSGKSTILSSHLTPAEFRERFKVELGRFGAVSMEFKDAGIVATVKQLSDELKALGGG